jgi:hypothetical protein
MMEPAVFPGLPSLSLPKGATSKADPGLPVGTSGFRRGPPAAPTLPAFVMVGY